jgi:hypothetical protein
MNTYTKLKFHLDRHMYKRGMYKGDAPADQYRRGRSHHRVVERTQFMAIRFHNTDILRAYPDGRVMLDCNGRERNITTLEALRDAYKFLSFRLSIGARSIMSLSQIVVQTPDGNHVLYYNGITFDEQGQVITPLRPFQARRIDKDESKEFMDELKASGFKDMYKILYSTAQPLEGTLGIYNPYRLNDTLINSDCASDWPFIIAKYKYERRWDRSGQMAWVETGNAQSCWARIMSACKSSMYRNIDTEVTQVSIK